MSHPAQDAFTEILPILLGGIGTPVPPNVEVLSFTQFVPEILGGRLIAGDTERLEVFRLDWNGQVGYADLEYDRNILQFDIQGWNAVETFVPLTDFYGLNVENHGVTTRRTLAEPQSCISEASCTYYP